MNLNKEYWQQRYQLADTPWDAGAPTRPIVEFMQRWPEKGSKILIPGAGSGCEGGWLWQQGFRQVYLLDWAPGAFEKFRERFPGFPETHLLTGDFFETRGAFDLILEQTFFCALPPSLRPEYASKMHELLAPGGILAGVLFDFPLTEEGPPFGGSEAGYRELFNPFFEIKTLEACRNSIPPREGRELFIRLVRAVKK